MVSFRRIKMVAVRLSDWFPVLVLRRFGDHDGPNWAVVIAWNLLLSIFPIGLALGAVAGFLLSKVGLGPDRVYRLVAEVFPSGLGAQSQAVAALEGLQERSGLLAVLALASFLWIASGLFGVMEQAFDRAFACPRRSFLPQKLMGLAMMAAFCVLALLAVATSALLPLLYSLPQVPLSLNRGPVGVAAQVAVGVAVGIGLFLLLYLVVPNRRLSVADVWPGAVFAGVAFELLTLLFPLYVHLNHGFNQYGAAFGLLFLVLAFFYFLGLITVLGAEVAALWAERRARPPLSRPGR